MGTTRDAINAGSCAVKYVVAIEGYPYLLTDATPAQAVAAWAGTDWGEVFEDPTVRALGGLFVEMDNSQQLQPWEPFQRGGSCMLRVAPDANDTFGKDTHKRASAFQTELTQTLDRDDTTINVQSTGSLPSAGTLFIGSECIVYTGTTSTTFTGCTRGVHSSFTNGAGGRFAQHHRVGVVDGGPKLRPLVTTQRRQWYGAWVAVYMHRVVGGVLDVKAQAELVYAGRIVSIGDDAATGSTTVELKHALDVLAESTVGREMWKAEGTGSILLLPGTIAYVKDYDGSDVVIGTPLTVLATGDTPSDATEILEGAYTYEQICAALTAWLAAAGVNGTYDIAPGPEASVGEDRTKIRWKFTGGSGTCWWRITLNSNIVNLLGFRKSVTDTINLGDKLFDSGAPDDDGDWNYFVAVDPPVTSLFGSVQTGTIAQSVVRVRMKLTNISGVFADNYDFLPEGIKDVADSVDGAVPWGVFLVDDQLFYLGQFVTIAGETFLDFAGQLDDLGDARRGRNPGSVAAGQNIEVRQVYVLSGSFADVVPQLILSTGTPGHNGADDVYPFGIGIGIPGGVASNLVASMAVVPGSDAQQLVVIDEPKKLSEIFHGESLLRGAFPRWKHGSLEMAAWSSPLASASVATLGEENKAAPLGAQDDHRTASLEDSTWARSIVKLDYSRDASSVNDDYATSLTIEDATAIDDAGGEAKPVTVKLMNTYSQYASQGAAVESLIPALLARFPLLARPMRRLTRSIDMRYWLSLSIGDVVTVSDLFARDPDTGLRGISNRTALVIRHRWNPGGLSIGSDSPNGMGGEIDLMLTDAEYQSPYVPSALVDETQTNAGYNSGTQTLTCYAHKYSEASEAADASYFPVDAVIRIIEVDPANPASPLSWERTVTNQTGNTIVHNGAALSGWDNSKKYRVVWADYDDVTSTQQANCFQADDTDGRIQNLANPRQYVFAAGDSGTTAPTLLDPIELVPTASYGDGRGRDVGHEMALARLANGLLDSKLARISPSLGVQAMFVPGVGTGYGIVSCSKLWLTRESSTSGTARRLQVSPLMRSTGGTARVRVSLCRSMPSGSSLVNVNRGTFTSMVFTTTSTDWVVPSTLSASLASVKNSAGFVYVVIEVNQNAETHGLAYCQESERYVL